MTTPTDLPHFDIGPVRTYNGDTPVNLPMSTMLASARKITSKDARLVKRSGQPWQDEAWDMYDLVGEQRFLATTLAGRLSQARLYVGEVTDNLVDHPDPTENEKVNALLESIGDTAAGRSQLLERMQVNLFVAGEGWLVGIPDHLLPGHGDTSPSEDDVLHLTWRTLSVTEITSTVDDKVKISWDQDDTIEASPDDLYLIRVWKPHPRKWWEADSSTRSTLSVLRELVGLTMHISAQVDSRLAGAGVLLVPQSARRALLSSMNLDESSEADPFGEALLEAMMTPIEDRASASALVPLTVTVPDESVEHFRHISFANELDDEARELREESIRRLALSQDAPPEVLLGTAGMNHWGAWLVREDVVTTHLEPPLALICDALTTQFLWPVLESWGMSREERQKYVIWYDVSDLVTRPNRSADAAMLNERNAISNSALRRELGFDEADAPEEIVLEETDPAVDAALRLVTGAPSLMENPGLDAIVAAIRRVTSGGDLEVPAPQGSSEIPAAIPQTDADPAEIPEPEEGA